MSAPIPAIRRLLILLGCWQFVCWSIATAQQFETSSPDLHPETRSSATPSIAPESPYRFTGQFHLEKDSTRGYLVLECELGHKNYIYSLTQTGAVSPFEIKVSPSADFRLLDQFQPDQAPTVVEDDPIFQQRLEKHLEHVRFFVPVEIHPQANPAELQAEIHFKGQVCSENGTCTPLRNQKTIARIAGFFERVAQRPEPNGAMSDASSDALRR